MLGIFATWVTKWQQIIILISILSMFLGSVGAIKQSNIKRLLAYSAISHVGYILIGVVCNNISGIEAVVHYLIIYATLNIGIFACILLRGNDEINSYAGIAKTNPLYAFLMATLLFSLAGIPPLAGFFAKFSILFAAINTNMVSLSVFAVLSSVISCYYSLRIIKVMYFDEPKMIMPQLNKNLNILFVAIFSALFNICYIFFSENILSFIKNSAVSVFL